MKMRNTKDQVAQDVMLDEIVNSTHQTFNEKGINTPEGWDALCKYIYLERFSCAKGHDYRRFEAEYETDKAAATIIIDQIKSGERLMNIPEKDISKLDCMKVEQENIDLMEKLCVFDDQSETIKPQVVWNMTRAYELGRIEGRKHC